MKILQLALIEQLFLPEFGDVFVTRRFNTISIRRSSRSKFDYNRIHACLCLFVVAPLSCPHTFRWPRWVIPSPISLVHQSCSELLLLLYRRDGRWMHRCVCLFRALTRIHPSSTRREEYRIGADCNPFPSTSYSFICLFLSFSNGAITRPSC